MITYLQVPEYYEHSCKFQKWYSWVMVLFILMQYICTEYRKKLAKKTAKTKKKQDSRQRQMFQILKLSVPKCF